MVKRWLLMIGLLAGLGPVAQAVADDLHPPNWRGAPGTTWAQWEFLNDNASPPPDAGFLPYGPPQIQIIPGPGAGWFPQNPPYAPQYPSGYGWWNLSGEMHILMQNQPQPNPHKEIWIQLTWSPQSPGNVPAIWITDPNGSSPETSTPLVHTVLYDQPFGLQVFHDVYHIDRRPNPPWEWINIRGGINVDEILIDTWCVPEPVSVMLLALGSLVLRRRRG